MKIHVPNLLALTLAGALGVSSQAARAADTEATKLYKSLPHHEQQMARAIVSMEVLYIAAVDYKGLGPRILETTSRNDFGSITDLREGDLAGLSARPAPTGPRSPNLGWSMRSARSGCQTCENIS